MVFLFTQLCFCTLDFVLYHTYRSSDTTTGVKSSPHHTGDCRFPSKFLQNPVNFVTKNSIFPVLVGILTPSDKDIASYIT